MNNSSTKFPSSVKHTLVVLIIAVVAVASVFFVFINENQKAGIAIDYYSIKYPKGVYQMVNGRRTYIYNTTLMSGEKRYVNIGDSAMLIGGKLHYIKKLTGSDTLRVKVTDFGFSKCDGHYALFEFPQRANGRFHAFRFYYVDAVNGYKKVSIAECDEDPKSEKYRYATDCAPFFTLDDGIIVKKL